MTPSFQISFGSVSNLALTIGQFANQTQMLQTNLLAKVLGEHIELTKVLPPGVLSVLGGVWQKLTEPFHIQNTLVHNY